MSDDGTIDRLVDLFGGFVGDIAAIPVVRLFGLALAAIAVMTWLAAAWWARADMRRRTADPGLPYLASALLVLASPVFFPLAVFGYVVVRPPRTVAASRRLALEEELDRLEADDPSPLRCRGCGLVTEEDWLRCPQCRERLGYRCAACDRPMGTDWTVCAWCAVPVDRPAVLHEISAQVPALAAAEHIQGHGAKHEPFASGGTRRELGSRPDRRRAEPAPDRRPAYRTKRPPAVPVGASGLRRDVRRD